MESNKILLLLLLFGVCLVCAEDLGKQWKYTGRSMLHKSFIKGHLKERLKEFDNAAKAKELVREATHHTTHYLVNADSKDLIKKKTELHSHMEDLANKDEKLNSLKHKVENLLEDLESNQIAKDEALIQPEVAKAEIELDKIDNEIQQNIREFDDTLQKERNVEKLADKYIVK